MIGQELDFACSNWLNSPVKHFTKMDNPVFSESRFVNSSFAKNA
jgi:hypothetical protein